MIKSPLTRFVISIEICTDEEEGEDDERETPLGKESIHPTSKRMYRKPEDLIDEHS